MDTLVRTVISQNAKGQTTFTSHQLTLSKQFLNFQEQWTIIVHLWGDTWSCYTQWVKTMSKVLWRQHNSENVFIPHTQKNAVPFLVPVFKKKNRFIPEPMHLTTNRYCIPSLFFPFGSIFHIWNQMLWSYMHHLWLTCVVTLKGVMWN